MIPKNPFLQAALYHSPINGSHYNPRTLTTKIISEEVKLDDDSPDIIKELFESNSTLAHEKCHWLQHHGTSCGVFLEMIRFSQQITTLQFIRSLPRDKVEHLLAARKAKVQRILNLNSRTNSPEFKPNEDELNLFRQIWVDHQLVHSLFEDSRIIEGMPKPPNSVIGEIFGDVMLMLCSHSDFQCANKNIILSDPLKPRKWFEPQPGTVKLLKCGDGRLTTKMIMESAAIIAEIKLSPIWKELTTKSDHDTALDKKLSQIIESDYGIPIRYLLITLGLEPCKRENILKVLDTINVLCFIALNPPLPPFVMGPPEGMDSWRWNDIYPPLRFAKLCNAVKEVGFISHCDTHDIIVSYIDELLSNSKLPSCHNIPYPDFVFRPETPDFSNKNSEYPETLQAPYHDYVFWVQSKLAKLRENDLPFLVNYGSCLSGDLAARYLKYLVISDEKVIPFTYSPLIWTSSNKLGYTCRKDFAHWLTRQNIVQNALFDVIVGDGKFDLSAYPPEIVESGFGDLLDDIMQKAFSMQNSE